MRAETVAGLAVAAVGTEEELYFFTSFAFRIRSSVVSDSKRHNATAGAQ